MKYPLNKEFSSVLERGSLEDIARLLESTAPRPEVSALIMLFVLSVCFTFGDSSASVNYQLFESPQLILCV